MATMVKPIKAIEVDHFIDLEGNKYLDFEALYATRPNELVSNIKASIDGEIFSIRSGYSSDEGPMLWVSKEV